MALLACLALAGPARAVRIVEFNLGCASGDRAPMWIELTGDTDEPLDAAYGVQALDRNGNLLWERRRVFGKWSSFLWFPNRTRFFIGTDATQATYADLPTASNFRFDAFMPAPMDTVAGTLVLFRLQGTVRVPLQEVRYGTPGALPAPPAGSSMEFVGIGWVWNPDPVAENYEFLQVSKGADCLGFPRFFLRELATACEDGGTQGQYLELEATGIGTTLDARMHVVSYDRDGRLLSDFADVFGARGGQSCAPGSRWLVGSPGYAAGPGGAPDAHLPVALDPLGGRVEVRGRFFGLEWMLDSLSYGNATRPRPPDGFAYEHSPLGRLVSIVEPTPTNSFGQPVPVPGCAFGTRPPAPFVQEISLQCADGGRDAQFVEIGARDGEVRLGSGWRLRAFDRAGSLSFEIPTLADAALGGKLTPGNGFLVAAPGHTALAGLAADAVLPAPLDTLAGRVELVLPSPGGDVVESVLEWGDAPLIRPVPGTSLAFNGRATVIAQAWPSPTDLSGRTREAAPCHATHSARGFVVNEVATHCVNGSTDGLFVEIASDSSRDAREPSLGLRISGPNGERLAQVFPLFAPARGGAWRADARWLVGAPGFGGQNGLTPDAVLGAAPDARLAQIQIFRRNLLTGTDSTLHVMAVSASPPAPGRSLVRRADGGYDVSGVVTPTRFDGTVVAPGLCYVRARPEAVRIGELMLRCRDGSTDAQYLEIEASGPDAAYAPDLQVRVFDRTREVVAVISHPFGALEGLPWRTGRPFTFAAGGFGARLGLTPDAVLPVTLDTLGGVLQLVLAGNEGGLVLDELRWGSDAMPVPLAGASFTRTGLEFTTDRLPSPATLAGDADRTNACLGVCPQRVVRMSFGAVQFLTTPRASLSSFEARVDYDATRGEVFLRSGFDETLAGLPDRFTVLALEPGTPVTLRARLEVRAQAQEICDSLRRCGGSVARARLTGGGRTDSLLATHDTLAMLVVPVTTTSGVPFDLDVFASGTGLPSRSLAAVVNARLLFDELPGGARVVSCYGYDSRTARGVGEAAVRAEPGNVSLSWPVLDPDAFRGTVERREPGGDWNVLEARFADADGILRIIDRTAQPLHTYEYRLSWDDVFGHQTTEAIRLFVPRRPAFGLLGVRPNPSSGVFAATIELAEPGEARLEVLDIAGRLVSSSRRLLPAGEHVIALARAGRLAPGLYVVRFRAHGLLAQTTAVVLK